MSRTWFSYDDDRSLFGFVPFQREDYWYCIVLHYADDESPPMSLKSVGLEVYRLDVPGDSYEAQTEAGREEFRQGNLVDIYFADFTEVVLGREENSLGVVCEQIYRVQRE